MGKRHYSLFAKIIILIDKADWMKYAIPFIER